MSRKGGYKIIDLKGLDFSEDMVIKGIHESIEDNYGKPLLFSGIVIDGVEKDDVFANAVVNGDGYDVTLYGNHYHISNNDVVSMNRIMKKLNETTDGNINLVENGIYQILLTKGMQLTSTSPIFISHNLDNNGNVSVEIGNYVEDTSNSFALDITLDSTSSINLIIAKSDFLTFVDEVREL